MSTLNSFLSICVAAAAVTGCSSAPETTAFHTTDPLTYEARIGREHIANVHVTSNGGYIGNSDEPMTHVAFDIESTATLPIVFDTNQLSLIVFDKDGAQLPPTSFVAVTPLGPAQVEIAPGTTVSLAGYFMLPVRPRAVGQMRVRWVLRAGEEHYDALTHFARDDDSL